MNVFSASKVAAVAALVFAGSAVFAQNPIITDQAQGQTAPADEAVKADWKPSLVRDGVYDRVAHTTRVLAWQDVRENDILWKKRVWREIDTREKQNMAFRFPGDDNSGGGMFIEILIDGIKKGKLKAYSPYDDRFTMALSKEQIMENMTGKDDTNFTPDPITGEMKTVITHQDFNPEAITKYRIKEDYVFDRNLGRMVVRIIGVAPILDKYDPNTGEFRGTQPLFWLYYPEAREVLAQYEVFNPNNDIARMNWDEFFETRMFASRITKVSNTFNADISSQSAGLEALYEGQRLGEEIFNKEHDMWVY